MTGNWTLEYMDEGVKHIHHMSNKITTEGVNRTINMQGTPMSTHTDMLRIIGVERLKNSVLKREIAAMKARAEEDAKVVRDQSDQIAEDKKEIAQLEERLGWQRKEIPVLRGAIKDRREVIAELELENKQTNDMVDLLLSDIRKKNATLEELDAELFVSKEAHRALVSAISTLKPVGTFNSIEWNFDVDKTYVILDGKFTLYEVAK
jgi:septal ring factor EnvC (AmiA/AmiB activator)